jgi:hypothetical protein
MDILNLTKALRSARTLLGATGGFTVNTETCEFPTTGYALSIDPEHTETLNDAYPTVGDLLGYVFDHEEILSREGKFFGGWVDTEDGTLYLDVVTLVEDKDTAISWAKRHKELAVFDLSAGTEIRVTD